MNPIFTKKNMGFNMPPQQMMAPSPEMAYQAPPPMMQMADHREKKRNWVLTAVGIGGLGLAAASGIGALQIASGAADTEFAAAVAENAERIEELKAMPIDQIPVQEQFMLTPEYTPPTVEELRNTFTGISAGTAAVTGTIGGVALAKSTKEEK